MKGVSEEVGKRGRNLEKMMNSCLEREREEKNKGKTRFLQFCVNWSEVKAKRSGSGLSTSPRTDWGKINPLGRNPESARAV